MIILVPHFATIPEKGKIIVCFINPSEQEVARAVIKTDEPKEELAKRAIDNLAKEDFVIGKPINGSRYSDSMGKVVEAETVDKQLMINTLKRIVFAKNQKKANSASTIGATSR